MTTQLEFIKEPDLLICTGSRLYGTQRYGPDGKTIISDTDLRGVVLPPVEYLIGLQGFDEGSITDDPAIDHKVWSLKNFFNMLLKGNAQALECMFAPDSHQQERTGLGIKILSMRSLFLGKHYYKSISGYSYSEWRKVRGVKMVVESRPKTIELLIQDYLNLCQNHPKDIKDEVIRLIESDLKKIEISNKSDVGEKRRVEYDRYGYCVSGAAHCLRLMSQCEELLRDGFMTFPRPEASFLAQVKRGEITFSTVEERYNEIQAKVEELYKTTKLPDRPDSAQVWNFYAEIVKKALKEESRWW